MIQQVSPPNYPTSGRRWVFAHCEYIELSRQLLVHGEPVKMESKPLDVLQHLLEEPAKTHTKEELIDAVWETATTDQSLATAISKLRTAFAVPRDQIILNISGIGYRLVVPVVCKLDPESGPPELKLKERDPIPGNHGDVLWIATRRLTPGEHPTVWVAENPKTKEVHVFKFAVDGIRLRALQREVAISRFLHQALPREERFLRITRWNYDQAPYFIESQFCGFNLFEFAETEDFRQMVLEERIAVASQIAGAMGLAHDLGVIHNDLKPTNILMMRLYLEGDKSPLLGLTAKDWQVKIADFGIASVEDLKSLQEMQITDHGQFDPTGEPGGRVGTAIYRAPELHRPGAAPSTRGDTYSLGVILYQLICGDFLDTPSIGWESRIEDPLLRDDIAAAANADPEQRLTNAGVLAERLTTLEHRRADRRRREADFAEKLHAEAIAARERLRRPWIAMAMIALVAGLCTSLYFYRTAARQRDLANSQNETLTSMLGFLSDDLLNQTNPLAASSANGSNLQITLLAAIEKALPQIDRRFSQSPEVAARLHSTIATALNSRLAYTEADAQFELAAQRFRDAEGPLSQNAIIAELQRENSQIGSRLPGSLAKATANFQEQQELIAKIPMVNPELQVWVALDQSAILIFGPNPEKALPILQQALQQAEHTPGFSRRLLLTLKLRFCSPYMALGDGANMERISRDVVKEATVLYGPDSPNLFEPEMFLQEALYLQGKYRETVEQANYNYAQFSRILGPGNLLTLDALDNRSGAEGMLEDYPDAIRDELTVYEAAKALPSGLYLELDTLTDASMHECRNGQFDLGIRHAREANRKSAAAAQPQFSNTSLFNLAECFISKREALGGRDKSSSVADAESTLKQVDLKFLDKANHSDDFDGNIDVAEARLALLRGDLEGARIYAAHAVPFMQRPVADPYEKRMLKQVQAVLQKSHF